MNKLFEFEKDICCYYNCNNKSIKAHAISKKISLSLISENNHLLKFSPRQINQYLKKEHFQNIGINEATTSKSFCKEHDEIFAHLDNNEITTIQDVLLQSYRMTSILLNNNRSVSRVNNYEEIPREAVINFLEQDKKYNELLEKFNDDIEDIIKRKILFEINERIYCDLAVIENFSIYLIQLFDCQNNNETIEKNNFYAFSTENMEYSLFFYKTDFQIPVAVNTMRHLIIDNDVFNYYINVIPYKSCNIILGIIPKQLISYSSIVSKIEKSFINKLSVLNFVESIIVSNDDWYIRPSIINSMNEEKRKIFMQDCMFNIERKFYDTYDLSIFDELRKNICFELNETKELEKISFIPKRKEYKERYMNMLNKIEKQSIINNITSTSSPDS